MSQINIKFLNLLNRADKASPVIGRDDELKQLVQILVKKRHHHACIVGEPGVGKSSLILLLAQAISAGALPGLAENCFELETAPIFNLLIAGENPQETYQIIQESLEKLPPTILVIEDIQLLATDDPIRLEQVMSLLQIIINIPQIHLIVSTTKSSYEKIFRRDYTFSRSLTPLQINQLPSDIVEHLTKKSLAEQNLKIEPEVLKQLIELADRYGGGRSLPETSLRLAEDIAAWAMFSAQAKISSEDVTSFVSRRENLPSASLKNKDSSWLKNLPRELDGRIIGQTKAIKSISRSIIKNELGLGHDSRPRSSFLLLGPSGVGKTETAKALTDLVYHNPRALTRLDMSEFSESNSVVRLTGAPPGFVGYEEGGQLTSAVQRQPYSLILLDEIEKAHPKSFDVFLQLLDDGRLTDSKGITADFTNSMVLATSNIGSEEIAEAAVKGVDITSKNFITHELMPLLLVTFRPEFINRFDAILVYKPLEVNHLVKIAKRELEKLSDKLKSHNITFEIRDNLLESLIRQDYNPLFGARPVRRLIADYFEMPIAEAIITGVLQKNSIITGEEDWLK